MLSTNKVLAIICQVFIVSACTTMGEVDRSNLPKLEGTGKALIVGDSENNHAILKGYDQQVVITSLDGKSLFRFGWGSDHPYSILVEPGRHNLGVKYMYRGGYAFSELWLDAESEKSYIVKKRVEGYSIFFWIENSLTGQKVGGIPGGEPRANSTK